MRYGIHFYLSKNLLPCSIGHNLFPSSRLPRCGQGPIDAGHTETKPIIWFGKMPAYGEVMLGANLNMWPTRDQDC